MNRKIPLEKGEKKLIKALIFDVFGTVVDWRTSVINECLELEKNTGCYR